MRVEGYGTVSGGGRSGRGRRIPKIARAIGHAPERHVIRSPFPPLTEEEGQRLLTSTGKLVRKAGSSLPADQRGPIIRLYREGRSLREIAEGTGLTIGVIRGALRAEDEPLRTKRATP